MEQKTDLVLNEQKDAAKKVQDSWTEQVYVVRSRHINPQGRLFGGDNNQTVWMCLNCGEIIKSTIAPQTCPVCRHGQDFFIRLDWAPYTARG